jgi:hypothetical protein
MFLETLTKIKLFFKNIKLLIVINIISIMNNTKVKFRILLKTSFSLKLCLTASEEKTKYAKKLIRTIKKTNNLYRKDDLKKETKIEGKLVFITK